MNQLPGTGVPPTMSMSSGPKPFFQVWIDALTKPNEMTYAEMANSPSVKSSTAYLWIFVGYLVNFFFASLVGNPSLRQMMEQYGGTQTGLGSGIGGRLIVAVCGAPIAAVIAVIFFAVGVAIVQWIAGMFGGKGNMTQLAYVFAAIEAPFLIIGGVVNLLAAIPFVGLCFSVLLGLAGLYVFVLQIMAVKGINQFGWGAAIGSLLIPGLVIGFVCGCLVIGSLMALGPVIGNVFSTINQSLTAP